MRSPTYHHYGPSPAAVDDRGCHAVDGRADPIADHSSGSAGRSPGARSRHRRGNRALPGDVARAITPSPARAAPHDPDAWLPLPTDMHALPNIHELRVQSEDLIDPAVDLAALELLVGPSPARATPHDPQSWIPLPDDVQSLPGVRELLDPSPEVQAAVVAEAEALVRASRVAEAAAAPSPARAEPHDPQSWLPLPDVDELAPLAELEPAPGSGDDQGGGTASRPRTRGARPRPRLVFAAFLAVATVCATVWIGRALTAPAGAEVSLVVDGGRHSVRTDVPTVGALLAASHVRLGAADRVSPDSSTRLRDGMRVTVVRAFIVSVDVDGSVSNVSTTVHNAKALAKELGLGKLVAVRGEPGRLDDGSEVVYRTRRTGSLMLDGQRIAYDSPSHTVQELLTTYNVKLLDDDRVEPAGPTVLTDGMEVMVVRVGGKFAYGTETIPFPTVQVPDSTLPIGETKVTQPGKDGVARQTYSVRLENGRQTSREVVSSVPSPAPVARVVAYGTKADWHWDELAQCESGGRWDTVDPGTSSGSGAIAHYDGGLGIYRGTWKAYGGEEFAPNAGLATREQQIIVGERIRADLGWDPWGCANNVLGWH